MFCIGVTLAFFGSKDQANSIVKESAKTNVGRVTLSARCISAIFNHHDITHVLAIECRRAQAMTVQMKEHIAAKSCRLRVLYVSIGVFECACDVSCSCLRTGFVQLLGNIVVQLFRRE